MNPECDCGRPAIPPRKPGGYRCKECLRIEKELYARKGLLGTVVRERKHFHERKRVEEEKLSLLVR